MTSTNLDFRIPRNDLCRCTDFVDIRVFDKLRDWVRAPPPQHPPPPNAIMIQYGEHYDVIQYGRQKFHHDVMILKSPRPCQFYGKERDKWWYYIYLTVWIVFFRVSIGVGMHQFAPFI